MKVKKAVIPAAGLGTRFFTSNKGDGKGNVANRGQTNDPIHR